MEETVMNRICWLLTIYGPDWFIYSRAWNFGLDRAVAYANS
jgi:hypothetical protein